MQEKTTSNQIKTQHLVQKPNWREFMKTNPDRVEICFFFQILQMLEELGKGRGTFLICYAPNM